MYVLKYHGVPYKYGSLFHNKQKKYKTMCKEMEMFAILI